MSTYQKTRNGCQSIFSRFQKNWRGDLTALEAFILAKESKIQELQESKETVENISFVDMQKSGLLAKDITPGCKR